ncbi:unnamed protein product [Dicrocoelium dendriticum]|nr:unnamed protein product [Dicrocoelium dendriticum]
MDRILVIVEFCFVGVVSCPTALFPSDTYRRSSSLLLDIVKIHFTANSFDSLYTPNLDLDQFEYFCEKLYTTNDPEVRSQAEKSCSALSERSDCPSICQLLLQRSSSCYSQFIAATALTKYVSNRDVVIPLTTRIEIRDYVLNYLASHAGLEKFVQQALVTLICRLTKAGWFDSTGESDGFRDILSCSSKFIESGQSRAVLIGVQLLNNLVSEMNHNTESDTTRIIFLQRKLSASFRDSLLFPIFRLSLSLLHEADKNIQSLDFRNPDQHGLVSHCLQLVHACLSYDFIGTTAGTGSTMGDESSTGLDDVVVIQIPTSWRSVFLEMDNIRLFFRLYNNLPSELSTLVLSCLVQLASIRRSLFTNPERSTLLSTLVDGTRNILASQHSNLANENTYHEFCRFLSRLKCNFQLTELITLDCYAEFIQLLTAFTIHTLKSFQQDTTNANSLHYLLALWQRLIASLPYVQSADSGLLEDAASQISAVYIESCLASATNYANSSPRIRLDVAKMKKTASAHNVWDISGSSFSRGDQLAKSGAQRNGPFTLDDDDADGVECLLDDQTTLLQQLEQFSVIGRCNFEKTCALLIRLFDETAGSYEKALSMASQSGTLDSSLLQVIRLDEHRLAWLVYMVGALISSRVSYASTEDDYDGELVCRVIQLVRLTTSRLSFPSGPGMQGDSSVAISTSDQLNQSPGAIRLEIAILNFFEQFRRMYVGESVGRMSRVYQKLSDVLGAADDLVVLNVFGTKIVTNLKYWSLNEPILNRTLNLLSELSRGYTAMRKLLRLDDIQFLLNNHTPENFPFLTISADWPTAPSVRHKARLRLRTSFYASLARLLMVDFGEDEDRFLKFMAPLTNAANQLIVAVLSGVPSSRMSPNYINHALVGLARDLRGLSSSLNTKSAYQMLLDWLYPTGFKLFARALELWPLDPTLNVSVLKLLAEIVHNRNGRLLFDPTVPTGYLLFTELSRILTAFGVQIIPNTREVPKQSLYQLKLKPIIAALDALKVCLSGGFINFGVFSLYRDDSLEKAVEMGVQLMLSLNDSELQDYPRVAQSFYLLLEYLLNDHVAFVGSLGDGVLNHFMRTIANGLLSIDTTVAENCCLCLDYILTHIFKLAQSQQNQRSSGVGLVSSPGPSDDPLRLISLESSALVSNGANQLRRYGVSGYAVWSARTPIAETTLLNLTKSSSDNLTLPAGSTLLQRILVILLSAVIQEDCRIQWSMTRPLLPLILLNNAYYLELRNRVIANLATIHREAVTRLFEKLMEEVEFNLSGKNRDKFTQNVSTFKHALGEFMKCANAKSPEERESDALLDEMNTGVNTEQYGTEYMCLSSTILQAAGFD